MVFFIYFREISWILVHNRSPNAKPKSPVNIYYLKLLIFVLDIKKVELDFCWLEKKENLSCFFFFYECFYLNNLFLLNYIDPWNLPGFRWDDVKKFIVFWNSNRKQKSLRTRCGKSITIFFFLICSSVKQNINVFFFKFN